MARLVFLHGGPGFNSCAETALLGPLLRDRGYEVSFWNEPSRLRPGGDPFSPTHAYEHWLASAEAVALTSSRETPVVVLAHSFTIVAALEIAHRHPDRLSGLVAIAPGADPYVMYRTVMHLAQADFAADNDPRASGLANCIAATRSILDAPMQEGLALCAEDPRLFDHYWVDRARQIAWSASRSGADVQFDGESFFAVLSDFRDRFEVLPASVRLDVPALGVFGTLDPVTPASAQETHLRAHFRQCDVVLIEHASHYPHLDAPDAFISALSRWLPTATGEKQQGSSTDDTSPVIGSVS